MQRYADLLSRVGLQTPSTCVLRVCGAMRDRYSGKIAKLRLTNQLIGRSVGDFRSRLDIIRDGIVKLLLPLDKLDDSITFGDRSIPRLFTPLAAISVSPDKSHAARDIFRKIERGSYIPS